MRALQDAIMENNQTLPLSAEEPGGFRQKTAMTLLIYFGV